MKKKCIAVMMLALVLSLQPAVALANRSPSAEGGGSSSGSESSSTTTTNPNTTVTVSSTGVKTTGATTSTSPGGSTIGVAVETVTTTGEKVTTNSKGQAVVGSTAIGFADGTSATAGLPEGVVSNINSINAGKSLGEVIKDVDLTSHHALTGTHAMITMDAGSGAVKTGMVEVSLYVPNLLETLSGVQVLFYENATGRWQLIAPVRVDSVSKIVTVNVPGSGTLTVVYKK